MKALLSILLVSLFAYIELYNGMVYVSYEINKSEFIQKYCVNQDKPEMKCQGTCHLKDIMLSKDDEKQSQERNRVVVPEILLFLTDIGIHLQDSTSELMTNFFYSNLYKFRFYDVIDIPPKQ